MCVPYPATLPITSSESWTHRVSTKISTGGAGVTSMVADAAIAWAVERWTVMRSELRPHGNKQPGLREC